MILVRAKMQTMPWGQRQGNQGDDDGSEPDTTDGGLQNEDNNKGRDKW